MSYDASDLAYCSLRFQSISQIRSVLGQEFLVSMLLGNSRLHAHLTSRSDQEAIQVQASKVLWLPSFGHVEYGTNAVRHGCNVGWDHHQSASIWHRSLLPPKPTCRNRYPQQQKRRVQTRRIPLLSVRQQRHSRMREKMQPKVVDIGEDRTQDPTRQDPPSCRGVESRVGFNPDTQDEQDKYSQNHQYKVSKDVLKVQKVKRGEAGASVFGTGSPLLGEPGQE